MHLAYLDDSDTKQKPRKLQVMSGVIVEDKKFKMVEIGMRSIRDVLVPPERIDQFEEFHASELYGGYGVFEGIDQKQRFEAIRRLLSLIEYADMAVVYGAVDIAKAKEQIYGSADVLDMAFRMCAQQIYEWAKQRIIGAEELDEDTIVSNWLQELVILIVDECDKKTERHAANLISESSSPPAIEKRT